MVHGDGDGGQRARGRARPALLWKFPVCLKKVPHLIFGTSEKVPHLILTTSEKFPVFMLVRRESSPKTRGETGVLEGVSMAVACFLGLQTSPFEKILVSPVRAFEAGGFGLSGHGLGDSVPRMQKRPWVADAALGLFRGMHFTRRAGFGVSGKCHGVRGGWSMGRWLAGLMVRRAHLEPIGDGRLAWGGGWQAKGRRRAVRFPPSRESVMWACRPTPQPTEIGGWGGRDRGAVAPLRGSRLRGNDGRGRGHLFSRQ